VRQARLADPRSQLTQRGLRRRIFQKALDAFVLDRAQRFGERRLIRL